MRPVESEKFLQDPFSLLPSARAIFNEIPSSYVKRLLKGLNVPEDSRRLALA
jgi:hypothetical protein